MALLLAAGRPAVAAPSVPAVPGTASATAWQPGDADDQILVLWKAAPSQADLDGEAARLRQPAGRPLARLRQDLDADSGAQTLRDTPLIHLHHVRLAAKGSAAVEAALEAYRASSLVEVAEPDPPIRAASCPYPVLNASLYTQGAQPGLTDTAWPQAMAAYCAGNFSLASPVVVAVLDTGIETAQPGLGGRVLAGYNFISPSAGTANDNNGHGTFCAGLIAAGPVSGSGLYGAFLDPTKISLLPVVILTACGQGDMGTLASGIVYAVQQGAKVISMSLEGSQGTDSLQAAINAARDAGVVLVAAAGNDSGPTAYPAAYAPVISVAALDHNDAPAYYSNYGKVDLSAPGGDGSCNDAYSSSATCESSGFSYGGPSPVSCVQVWSLSASWTHFCSFAPQSCIYSDGYADGSGTSFAGPLVAAAAALLLSQDPGRSPQDVYQLLLQSAAPTALGPGFHSATGWGKLDFDQALNPSFHAAAAVAQPTVYNYPNPFHPSSDGVTTFSAQLNGNGAATLDVFDAGGQLVRHWDLPGRAGMQLQAWDGHNGRGQLVANGGYRAVLTQGGARAVAKVAVIQ